MSSRPSDGYIKKYDYKNSRNSYLFSRQEKKPHQSPVTSLPSPAKQNAVAPSRRPVKVLGDKISFIMILLAANTIADIGLTEHKLSTELMSDTFRFTGRPSMSEEDDFFSYSTYSNEKCYTYNTDLSEGVSSSNSNTEGSKCGDDDDDDDEEETYDAALRYLSLRASSNQRAFNHNAKVWYNIMSFLPYQSVLRLRGVSHFHFQQSLNFAAVLRLPNTSVPAVFIPCREDLEIDEEKIENALSKMPVQSWSCSSCGRFNRDSDSPTCNNIRCQAPRNDKGSRVFMGQLRRDATVPMVQWLLREVVQIPREELLMVENHRNSNTGRGKGCAWPTVSDRNGAAQKLLSLHHRIFFDCLEGVEGVWWVPDDPKSIQALENEAKSRSAASAHLKHMPRSTVVVELPAAQKHTTVPPSAPSLLPPPYFNAQSGPEFDKMAAYSQPPAYQSSVPSYYYAGDEYAVVYEGMDSYRNNPYVPVYLY